MLISLILKKKKKKNTFIETFRITSEQMSGYHGVVKLTHKINHCKHGHQLG